MVIGSLTLMGGQANAVFALVASVLGGPQDSRRQGPACSGNNGNGQGSGNGKGDDNENGGRLASGK